MADPLQKLFGSAARLKLLRLFLFNPKDTYTVPDAAYRSRVPERTAHKELALFSTIGLIKRSPTRSGSGVRYSVNEHFEYVAVLQNLLINAPARAKDIYETIRSAGAIKLIVVAGGFFWDRGSGLDVFVVSAPPKKRGVGPKKRTVGGGVGR